jgi:hypothetical protein
MIKKVVGICWRFVVSSKVMIDVPRQGFARYFRFGREEVLAEVDHVRAQTGR